MNAQDIAILENKLIEASDRYYNHGDSVLSDNEYDDGIKLLKKYKPNSQLLKQVGAPVQGETIKHKLPMLSLDDYWNESELTESFKDLLERRELVPEFKYDGIAVSVVYIDGKLSYAATRGDKTNGEVITESVVYVNGIPRVLNKPIKGRVEVRGEIMIPYKSFFELKEKLGYANPRNTVAGLLRRKDTSFLNGAGLCFMPYDLTEFPDISFARYSDQLIIIDNYGVGCLSSPDFTDTFNWFYKLRDGFLSFAMSFKVFTDSVLEKRGDMPFDIDGLVFKTNSLNKRKELGNSDRVPKWAFAFKFPGDSAVTTLKQVEWQVSRNGILTPVGKVSKVYIGGVNYTSVTLHNIEEIKRLGLRYGDRILIERRGDVIPKVIKVIETNTDGMVIIGPILCPCCNGPVVPVGDNGIYLQCLGDSYCKDQLIGKIVHYSSRKAADIEGLAESTAKLLIQSGLVKYIPSIYSLTFSDINNLEGFAEDSTNNLLKAIEKSRGVELPNLLFGLGISDIGETTAKKLAALIGSFDRLLELGKSKELYDETLSAVSLSDIDSLARKSLYEYITSSKTKNIIEGLISHGINPSFVSTSLSTKLKGQTWAITGSFPGVNRDDLKLLLSSHGASVSSGISKSTTGLLAGDKAGSKLRLAELMKVPVYTLQQINEMLIEKG